MFKGASTSLEEGLKIEKQLIEYLVSTQDFAEGVRAFVEKKKPQYKAL